MEEKKDRNDDRPGDPGGYDPPAVEESLDARELAREVHYAGGVGSPGSGAG